MADETTVNSSLCPLQDGITHNLVTTGSTVHENNNLGVGYGFSGRSQKAAREDHIHPLNVNLNFKPAPVGAYPPGDTNDRADIDTVGYPGVVGDNSYKTRAYALANHIHSYLFADWMCNNGKNGTIEAFKPLPDGVKWTSSSPFAYHVTAVDKAVALSYIPHGITINEDFTWTYVEEGFRGVAGYPARADHSHPINAPEKSEQTNRDSAIGEGGVAYDDTTVPVGIDLDEGVSSRYARADHVHKLAFPSIRDDAYVGGRDGTSTGANISDGVITLWGGYSTGQGSLGTSMYAARLDHTHALNVPQESDTDKLPKSVGGENANGESTYYARLDHVHSLPTDAPTSLNEIVSGPVGGGIDNSGLSPRPSDGLLADLWTRAEENTTGMQIRIPTRICCNGANLVILYRTLAFDRHGLLHSVSAENENLTAF